MPHNDKSKSITRFLFWSTLFFTVLFYIIYSNDNNSSLSDIEYQTIIACQDAIRRNVNHPSTLKMNTILGSAAEAKNGKILVTQEFSAKNAFNLEKKMVGYCKSENGVTTLVGIEERNY